MRLGWGLPVGRVGSGLDGGDMLGLGQVMGWVRLVGWGTNKRLCRGLWVRIG